MISKELHKHPWFDELPQPTLVRFGIKSLSYLFSSILKSFQVKKVLVHEEVFLFQYDNMEGEDFLLAVHIEDKNSIKVTFNLFHLFQNIQTSFLLAIMV